jgi:rare lipoprotein A
MNSFEPLKAAIVALLLFLSCTASPRFGQRTGASDRPSATNSPSPTTSSTSKALLTLEGIASYYADAFHGKQAANGEMFNMNDLVAAHRTLPFGTRLRVTNTANGKSVVVRIIDRGPYVEGRILDLSLGAAKVIDMVASGTARVRIEVVEWGTGELYHNR